MIRSLPLLLLAMRLVAGETVPAAPPWLPLVQHNPTVHWYTSSRQPAQPVHYLLHQGFQIGPQVLPVHVAVTVGGSTWRLVGSADGGAATAMPMIAAELLPTRSVQRFAQQDLAVTLTWTSTALPADLAVHSRPVTWISAEVAKGGMPVEATLSVALGALAATYDANAPMAWSRCDPPAGQAVGLGTADRGAELARLQRGMRAGGGRLSERAPWAWLVLAGGAGATARCAPYADLTAAIASGATLPADDASAPRPSSDRMPGIAVQVRGTGSLTAALASDEPAAGYLDQVPLPFWWRDGVSDADAPRALATWAVAEGPRLTAQATAFDRALMDEATAAGGRDLAELVALAHRTSLASQQLARAPDGRLLVIQKELTTGSFTNTLDVIYPQAPQLLLLNPDLLIGLLHPLMDVAARTKEAWAPHDVGRFPQIRRTAYGSAMPIEESGNVILLCAAIAEVRGIAAIPPAWWPLLTRYAALLEKDGAKPPKQVTTDDFAGHMDGSTNLSIKAILGLGGWGRMCTARGDKAEGDRITALAKQMANDWARDADSGTHYRMLFPKPESFGLKYNLVWDRVLGLNLFPPQVARTELAFYRGTMLKPYGIPLFSTWGSTKTDWLMWSALLTGERADQDALIGALARAHREGGLDGPPTDIYDHDRYKPMNPKTAKGETKARPVLGAYFMPLLTDRARWQRWADAAQAGKNHP